MILEDSLVVCEKRPFVARTKIFHNLIVDAASAIVSSTTADGMVEV